MTPEEFRTAGHRLVDWIADYRARVADGPVMTPCRSRSHLLTPPKPGTVASLGRRRLSHSAHPGSPSRSWPLCNWEQGTEGARPTVDGMKQPAIASVVRRNTGTP